MENLDDVDKRFSVSIFYFSWFKSISATFREFSHSGRDCCPWQSSGIFKDNCSTTQSRWFRESFCSFGQEIIWRLVWSCCLWKHTYNRLVNIFNILLLIRVTWFLLSKHCYPLLLMLIEAYPFSSKCFVMENVHLLWM